MRFSMVLVGLCILGGCQEEIKTPDPVALTREADGFYCNMIVIDHPGPKAQIFEKDRARAIWFTSVRDALAYNILPGEAQHVLAIYVHDMGQASSWEHPEKDGIWMNAQEAHYVIGSDKRGGMGAKETIPFSDLDKARNFARQYGGQVVAYGDIPAEYLLGDAGEYDAASVE